MIKEFNDKFDLVPENEVPEGLLTPQESILLEHFDGVDSVRLSDVISTAKNLFKDISDIELRKLALSVYHIITDARQSTHKALLNPNVGPRAITRRNRAASAQRLRNIGRASIPSEPPPAVS